MCGRSLPTDRPSLPALLRQTGVHTTLLTDDRAVAEHELAVDFDELVQIDPPWQSGRVEQLDQTHLAQCCVRIIEWLESAPDLLKQRPFLLWCHLSGLGTIWDAPMDLARAYWEPGDPEPLDTVEVPNRMLAEDHDPDEVLAIEQAYSGQISLLDTCLGACFDVLDEGPLARETLLTLTSPRGFPLGEHGRLGPCDEAIYAELVHVPMILRFPDRLGAAARSSELVTPADLWATLLDWWQVADVPPSPVATGLIPIIRGDVTRARDRLCLLGGDSQRAIRTPAWYLRMADGAELFAKPDDRWEVNDVADRCREVVDCLGDVLEEYRHTLPSGLADELPPLDDVLLRGF